MAKRKMGLVSIYMNKVEFIKVNLSIIKKMDQVLKYMPMEICILDFFIIIKNMEKVSFIGTIYQIQIINIIITIITYNFIKGNGLQDFLMAMEFIIKLMVMYIQVFFKMD